MSKLRKNNNKSVREVAIVKSTLPIVSVAPKINRLVLAIMLSLMASIIFIGILLMPNTTDVLPIQKTTQLHEIDINPVTSAEVDALKSQLVGLVSGSIEGKLKRLEDSLRSGTINSTGLETIQALQEDLVVLKTYSETGSGRLIAEKYRQNTVENVKAINLADEVSQLKQLVYLLFSSCALILAACCGVWIRKQYQLSYDESVEVVEKRLIK